MLPEYSTRTSSDQTAVIAEWLGGNAEVRPISNAPGYYVTCTGLVISSRVYKRYGRAIFRVLRTMRHSQGYPQVNLCVNGKGQIRTVHSLMALEFLPPPLPGQVEVRHRDDNPENNTATNLAWGTHGENMADMKANGNSAKGERNGHAKVADSDIPRIRRLASLGIPQSLIAEVYGVERGTVSDITLCRTWSHIE